MNRNVGMLNHSPSQAFIILRVPDRVNSSGFATLVATGVGHNRLEFPSPSFALGLGSGPTR